MEVTFGSRNQVTIPKKIREHLHLKPGDRLKFFLQPDGGVAILPKMSVANLKGSLPRPSRPVSVKAINKAIKDGAVKNAQSVVR